MPDDLKKLNERVRSQIQQEAAVERTHMCLDTCVCVHLEQARLAVGTSQGSLYQKSYEALDQPEKFLFQKSFVLVMPFDPPIIL